MRLHDRTTLANENPSEIQVILLAMVKKRSNDARRARDACSTMNKRLVACLMLELKKGYSLCKRVQWDLVTIVEANVPILDRFNLLVGRLGRNVQHGLDAFKILVSEARGVPVVPDIQEVGNFAHRLCFVPVGHVSYYPRSSYRCMRGLRSNGTCREDGGTGGSSEST